MENSLRDYYANDSVRARIVEFLGGRFLHDATCEYIIGLNGGNAPTTPSPVEQLPSCFDQSCDLARSMWDREVLLAHLDIEYVNFDFPGEPYLDPARIFRLQRPVVQAVQNVLLGYGIAPLHMLTGRGHHFVWSIKRDSSAYRKLVRMGRVSAELEEAYAQAHPPHDHPVDADQAKAFAGLSLVMEYLGHLIKQDAAPRTTTAIQLTDIEVGCGERGREAISIDISEYFDPLHTRHIRAPFSVYLKTHRKRASIGDHVVQETPLIFQIPLFEMSEAEAVEVMREPGKAADLASRACVRIPDQSTPTKELIADYCSSSLAQFHDRFYQQQPHPSAEWPDTYDRTQLDGIPSCTSTILRHPNDLLLKPAGIQHLVRVLMSLGWHPRHIAGLICSKYQRDYGWGERFLYYNAGYRADGYTRLFAGLIAAGQDRLVDFNCVSNREKGYCFEPDCGHNLDDYRNSLSSRREYERLGSGPFNRLFLPYEHL